MLFSISEFTFTSQAFWRRRDDLGFFCHVLGTENKNGRGGLPLVVDSICRKRELSDPGVGGYKSGTKT